MMSNCGFWSAAGELLAVHGAQPGLDPRSSFPAWAAQQRLTPGRLVAVSPTLGLPEAPGPGWARLDPPPARRRPKPPRPCEAQAPVAAFAPALDTAAGRLFPLAYHHDQFTWTAWPTWVVSPKADPAEPQDGWFAALDPQKVSRFVVRLVPHRGRLPGQGWRNMLAWTLRETKGLRLVPLNAPPSPEALAAVPAWEYRAEAGQGDDAAAWDVQVIPSRRWLAEAAPGTSDPWEATALLRWLRPRNPAPMVPEEPWQLPEVLGVLPPTDARRLVQNGLVPLGPRAAAEQVFDAVALAATEGRPALVRYRPRSDLPLSLLTVLFGRRAWHEVDLAKKRLDPTEDLTEVRQAFVADLDLRIAEGRLELSPGGLALWEAGIREPRRKADRAELAAFRASERWSALMAGDPRRAEFVLRRLDVTDLALCLRDAPDRRWRRFVTKNREEEVRAEQEFCQVWIARGELTLERELDAWRSWDLEVEAFGLTESDPRH